MKKFIFMMIAFIGAITMNAQTVEKSRFTDNWSIGLKGGVTTPFAHSPFWGDMRGIFGIELKKDITPIIGLGVEGEWTVNTSSWWRNIHSNNAFDHQLVGGFMTANMMNAFMGYNGTPRFFEVELVGGIGWLHAYHTPTDDTNSWYTKFGANFNFNLGQSREWMVSFKPAVVFDMNDGINTNYNVNRGVLELQVGVAYRFKNSNGTHSFRICDKVATQSEVDELNNEINHLRSVKPDTVIQYVDRVINNPVTIDNTALNNTIGFTINSDVVSETEYAGLSNIADWIKKHENCNVIIKGYADGETGTPEYNLDLATRRAIAVRDILVNEFGIDEEQVSVVGVGDTEQIYSSNNWNRVVVFEIAD